MNKLWVVVPRQRFLIDDDYDEEGKSSDDIDWYEATDQYDIQLSNVLNDVEYEFEIEYVVEK